MEEIHSVGKRVRLVRTAWLTSVWVMERIADALIEYTSIVVREVELFAGSALTIIALMHFENGKNCDGNTADYLSCTRPSTFYYYNWLEIIVAVIGVSLVLIWILKKWEQRARA